MDEDKAAALGIRAFIMKPVVRDQLTATIRKVLDDVSPASSVPPDNY